MRMLVRFVLIAIFFMLGHTSKVSARPMLCSLDNDEKSTHLAIINQREQLNDNTTEAQSSISLTSSEQLQTGHDTSNQPISIQMSDEEYQELLAQMSALEVEYQRLSDLMSASWGR